MAYCLTTESRLIAWRYQDITWKLKKDNHGIYLGGISQGVLMNIIHNMSS